MDDSIAKNSQTDGAPAQDLDGSLAPTSDGYRCMQCSYALDGLPADGDCPECGTSVHSSMRGMLLVHRSPEYVKSLRRGLSLVLNGILLYVILQIGAAVVGAVAGGTGWTPGNLFAINIATGVAAFGVSMMILFGYWMFTTRDPGDTTPDGAATARVVLRIAVVFNAAMSLIAIIAVFITSFGVGGVAPGGAIPGSMVAGLILASVTSIGGFAGLAVQFFSAMLYVRRMAPRLPNEKIYKLTKSRMIWCPILATVGVVLLFLGPLIALVMYWNLLDMVRKELKRIVREQTLVAA